MKKTPRDILLSRHATATPQLDQLRHATLAEATPIPTRQLLHALFFPQRRLWLGLAAAWIVIVAFHVTQRPANRPSNSFSSKLYASNWSANQTHLHALLSETNAYR